MEFSSLNMMFRHRVQTSPRATAFLQKREGRWTELSWQRAYESVRHIAMGLDTLGIRKGDRVALLASSRAEWAFCDLAILSLGAVTVPVYLTSPARDLRHILNHSQSRLLIVENPRLLDKVREVRGDLETLERIILMEGPPPDDDEDLRMLSSLVEIGRQQPESRFEQLSAAVMREDDATIIYTSTSGPLLGVVHGHGQLMAQQDALAKALPVREGETALMLLPLAHIFGRTLVFAGLSFGLRLAFTDPHERLEQSLLEIHPQVLAAVPRIHQRFYASILKEVEQQGRAMGYLVDWSRRVGEKALGASSRGTLVPLTLRLKQQAARLLFFERIRRRFGRNLRFLVSSGAPLPLEVAEFFAAADIPILEAYGMTETAGAVTMTPPGRIKLGSVGKALDGVDLKLAEDGEILVKGPSLMRGYWRDPGRTSQALRDGWLRTGDIGELDEDGFLRITDRKKDILITAGGKSISPLNIENLFKSDPYIDHLCVHGDRRNFVSALVALNRENLISWARDHNLPTADFAALAQRPEVKRLIEERIHLHNKELAGAASIKKFAILPEGFSVDGGELTSTMKLNRRLIEQKYRDILDGFYA